MSEYYKDLLEALLKTTHEKYPPIVSPVAEALSKALTSPLTQPYMPSLQPISLTKRNLYYRSKTIYIDGYTFENCRFDNCTLITKKGTFQFINCVFDDTTIVKYEGNALKVLKLYNRKEQTRVPGLSPQDNQDGTITIE